MARTMANLTRILQKNPKPKSDPNNRHEKLVNYDKIYKINGLVSQTEKEMVNESVSVQAVQKNWLIEKKK